MVSLEMMATLLMVLVLGATLVAARERLRRRNLRPVPVQARRMRRVNGKY